MDWKQWNRIVLALCVGILLFTSANAAKKKKANKKAPSNRCSICEIVVNTFAEGLTKTDRVKHFGGGDTEWEELKWKEKRLLNYEDSELRLIEIMEDSVCHVEKSADQKDCHTLVEKHEEDIENWWFNHKKTQPDMFIHLCIETLKLCCPDRTYGPDCEPCHTSDQDQLCRGTGKCDGNGTRQGTGKCSCDTGYTGDTCEHCDKSHYEEFRNESFTSCLECHEACNKTIGCDGSGPGQCKICAAGWLRDSGGVCSDRDECKTYEDGKPLKHNHFNCPYDKYCVNKVGSYECPSCHKSCDTCLSEGAKGCRSCKKGWEMDNEDGCVDVDECDNSDVCKPSEYCLNTDGSYSCNKCASECNGCEGPGSNHCKLCADGYVVSKNGHCMTPEQAEAAMTAEAEENAGMTESETGDASEQDEDVAHQDESESESVIDDESPSAADGDDGGPHRALPVKTGDSGEEHEHREL